MAVSPTRRFSGERGAGGSNGGVSPKKIGRNSKGAWHHSPHHLCSPQTNEAGIEPPQTDGAPAPRARRRTTSSTEKTASSERFSTKTPFLMSSRTWGRQGKRQEGGEKVRGTVSSTQERQIRCSTQQRQTPDVNPALLAPPAGWCATGPGGRSPSHCRSPGRTPCTGT